MTESDMVAQCLVDKKSLAYTTTAIDGNEFRSGALGMPLQFLYLFGSTYDDAHDIVYWRSSYKFQIRLSKSDAKVHIFFHSAKKT